MNDSRYSQLSAKPKSFFLTPIENYIHTRHQSACSHLDPIPPKTPKHIVSASFDLSSSRIPQSLQMKVSALFKKPTVEEKQKISKRIKNNKNLAVMSKEAKAEAAQIKAMKHDVRVKLTKIAKQKIYEEKKSCRESKLKEKFQKFQYRINIIVQEIQTIVKSWLFLGVLIGISTVSKHLIKNKRSLRARSCRLLTWLRAFSRALGKILIIRLKIQSKKALRKINIFGLHHLRNWKKKITQSKKNILISVLEHQISTAILTKLIKTWELKIIFLKHKLREFMRHQLTLYESLLIKWNTTEHVLFGNENAPKRRRTLVFLSNTKAATNGCTSIPDDIKLYYLRLTVKKIMFTFIKDHRSYKSKFKWVNHRNLENKWSGYTANMIEYPIRPEPPQVYEQFTQEKLSELINLALKERGSWTKLLDSQDRVSLRSFLRFSTKS